MMQIVPVVEKQVAYLHVLAKLFFAGVFVVTDTRSFPHPRLISPRIVTNLYLPLIFSRGLLARLTRKLPNQTLWH